MKKTAILLVLVLAISAYGFAETGFGLSVAYPIANFNDNFDLEDLGYESFLYGIALREKMAIFLLDVSLYSNFGVDGLVAPIDAGLCFDVFTILRLGVGAGITLLYSFDDLGDGLDRFKWLPNIKANVDIKLGKLTLGVSGAYHIFFNPADSAAWSANRDYLVSTEGILSSTWMSLNLIYWFGDEIKKAEKADD